MKRSSNQICNGRIAIAGVLVLSLFFLMIHPVRSASQVAGDNVMRQQLPQGTIAGRDLSVRNTCAQVHLFAVYDHPDFVRFEPPSGTVSVGPNSTNPIKLVFDATRMQAGDYAFVLTVACLDCVTGPACHMLDGKVSVEIKITASRSQRQSAQSVNASVLASLFARFFETLARLAHEPWAADKKHARLLESITNSVTRLKKKSEAGAAIPPEQYLQSLRINLDFLKSLLTTVRGSEKPGFTFERARLETVSYLAASAAAEVSSESGGAASQKSRPSPGRKKLPRELSKGLEVVDKDFKIKAEHADSTSGEWPDMVEVSVVTKKNNKVVNGHEVWSVAELWENSPELRERFSTFTSPSVKALAPGAYLIGIKERNGERQQIGGDGRSHQQVDLRAP